MYKIRIKHNDVIVSEKALDRAECESIGGTGVQFIFNAYKKHFNFDIGKYRISDYDNGEDFFTLFIKTDDLIKLRDKKLSELGL